MSDRSIGHNPKSRFIFPAELESATEEFGRIEHRVNDIVENYDSGQYPDAFPKESE